MSGVVEKHRARVAGVRPPDGVRVVEAASMVRVPSAAAMAADFGADVVKVEPLDDAVVYRLR